MFSFDHASFEKVEANCRGANGSLASDLNKETYLKFNECCFNTPSLQYYVGLFVNDKCKQNSRSPLQWVGSKKCSNGWPLSNLNPQSNPTCQAVSITTKNAKDMLPTSTLLHCTTGQRYICQFQISSAFSLSAAPTTTALKEASGEPLEKISLSSTTAVSISSVFNPALVVVIIAVILIILLLALVLLCLFKKKCFTNFLSTENNKEPISLNTTKKRKKDFKQERNNPLYDG